MDIGSTSIQLSVAEVGDGVITTIRKEKRIARLADELESTGLLSDRAFEEIEASLRLFQDITRSMALEMRVTATATMRAAKNRAELMAYIHRKLGIHIHLLTGAEEARLVLQGVLFGHPNFREKRLLAVDVGGGSSELITSIYGQPATIASVAIGALVVHQKWLSFERPTWSSVRNARRFIRARFSDSVHLSRAVDIDTLVATGGTIQRLVRLARERNLSADEIDGEWLSQDDLNQCIEKLMRAKTYEGRRELLGMDPDRADFILGGALVYAVIMEGFHASGWRVSTSALRTGMLTSAT